MDNGKAVVALLGILMFAGPTALMAAPTPAATGNTIVIVFKAGPNQAFSTAALERVEFKPPASNSATTRGNSFLGKWKVGDGSGANFLITLNRDGSASKSQGASHGTWIVVENEARISWDDGW